MKHKATIFCKDCTYPKGKFEVEATTRKKTLELAKKTLAKHKRLEHETFRRN